MSRNNVKIKKSSEARRIHTASTMEFSKRPNSIGCFMVEPLESRRMLDGLQTFSALDAGAGPTAPRPNSDAAAASFDAAASAIAPESIITFEGVPTGSVDSTSNLTVAPGVTINGVNKGGNPQAVLNSPSDPGAPRLSGYNTTEGGSEYVNLVGGTVTFTFASPIQYFGAYFPGSQDFFGNEIDFTDADGAEVVDIPGGSSSAGGVAFAGFVDPGASITSVTINGGDEDDWDAFGVDDVRYQQGTPLTAVFSSPQPISAFFPGESSDAQFVISNPSTTTTADETVDTEFFLETNPSLDGQGVSVGDPTVDAVDAPVSSEINLQPGAKSSTFDFHFTIPASTPRGNYYIVGDVDPSDNLMNDNGTGQVFSVPITINLVKPGDASDNVYNDATSSPPPVGYTPFDYSTDYGGFLARAYENGDKSQVIIAFRGTVPTDIENLYADASFVGRSTPTQTLSRYANDAALFVNKVHSKLPDAHIMLTGHSLGGAIAQLVGAESGLLTDAFNAPMAGGLLNALSTELSPAGVLDTGQTNTNYRIFGDQVSLAGSAPIGTTVVLPPPSNLTTTLLSIFEDLGSPLASLETYYLLHIMNYSVLPDLISNAPPYSGSDEPNDAAALESLSSPTSSVASDGVISEEFDEQITVGDEQFFDPTGSDFVLTTEGSSPSLKSVDLPVLTGVVSYSVRYETGGTWSSYAPASPGTFAVGSGATAVDFEPLDSAGAVVSSDSPFVFGATFASTGTFSGTLVSSGLSTSATPGSVTPSITKETIKAAYVGGKATRGSFSLSLSNTSTAIERGPVTIGLYASPDGEIDNSSFLIGTKAIKSVKILAGKTFRTSLIGTLPASFSGNYTLLATAIDPAGYTTDASSGPVTKIAAPFVTLSASITAAAPTTLVAGKVASFVVTISNSGNIVASGAAKLTYGVTVSGIEVASSIITVKREVSIKPGAKLVLKYRLPTKGLAPGTYYPTINIALGSETISALAISPITVG